MPPTYKKISIKTTNYITGYNNSNNKYKILYREKNNSYDINKKYIKNILKMGFKRL